MTLYYVLGRILRPGAAVGFYIYNHVFKKPRARVVVRNEFDEILLVRSWVGTATWDLPGGGVEHNEDTIAAAKRELFEETGMDISLDALRYVATATSAGYPAPIYATKVKKLQLPQKRHNPLEIVSIGWFKQEALPPLSRLTEEVLVKVAQDASF